jgi:cytochrome c oxidase cbb3-type subunit 3
MSNKPKDNQEDPLLLDHDYDGIRELDNKLPRWWVYLFWCCNIFAPFYLGYYHLFAKGSIAEVGQMRTEYAEEMRIGDAIKSKSVAEFEGKVDSLEPSKDAAILARGQATFRSKCSPCHRPDAGGLVGPNLCDDYWIHGPKFADNVRTIWNGFESKGMLAWKKQGMKPAEVIEVASYIYTLRGSNPKNPKPAENTAPVKTGPSEFE